MSNFAVFVAFVHLYRYCQKLPHDLYTVLTPVFKTERREAKAGELELRGDHSLPYPAELELPPYMYRSTMTLPMNCPVKEVIEVSECVHGRVIDVGGKKPLWPHLQHTHYQN